MPENEAVAERSEWSEDIESRNLLSRTLMGGTDAMKAAGRTYLPQECKEKDAPYERRLERSFLFNGFRYAVLALSGRPFKNPLRLRDGTPDRVVEWAKNVDQTGRSLHLFARDLMSDGLVGGQSGILIGKNGGGDAENLAEERSIPVHWQIIPVESIFGWRADVSSGIPILTQLRIYEEVDVDDGLWGTRVESRVRVLEPGGEDVYVKDDDTDDWLLREDLSSESGLDYIPFVSFYAIQRGFMQSLPPLEDLASVNLAHWQSQSDQRHILHVARVPVLFGAGFPEANDGTNAEFEISINSAIIASEPSASLKYVEHSGAAIAAGRTDLKDLEQQMAILAMEPFMVQSGSVSATASALQTAESHSLLQAITLNLREALNEGIRITEELMGEESGGGEVEMNTEYGLALREAEHVGALLQMRLANDLSRDTLWNELKRRDVLSDGFTNEAEHAKMDEEGLPLMALAPPMEATDEAEEEIVEAIEEEEEEEG